MAIELTEEGEHYAKLAKQIAGEQPPAWADEWVKENADTGCEVVDANTGHPRRAMHERLVKCLQELVSDDIKYSPAQGSKETRDNVIRFFRQYNEVPVAGAEQFNIPLDADNVVLTGNGTEAFSRLILHIAGKGGKIGLPRGYYSAYQLSINTHESVKAAIDADAENNFFPTYQQLMDFYHKNPDVKMIFMPTGNPTGCRCSGEQAVEMARAANDIHKESGGKIAFIVDDAYVGLTHKPDYTIFPYLNKDAQENAIYIYTGSKILSLTSMIGAVIAADKNVIAAITQHRNTNNLSAPTIGEPLFNEGLKMLIHEQAEAMMKPGVNPRNYGLLGELTESYIKEIKYVEKGLEELSESLNANPPIIDHSTDKALYIFPNFGCLVGRKIPDLPLAKGKSTLPEFMGTDKIRDDKDIKKMLYAMALLKKDGVGVDCRPGNIFGVENYLRFSCTGSRENHEKLLTTIKDMCGLLGLKQAKDKPFDYVESARKEEENQPALGRA